MGSKLWRAERVETKRLYGAKDEFIQMQCQRPLCFFCFCTLMPSGLAHWSGGSAKGSPTDWWIASAAIRRVCTPCLLFVRCVCCITFTRCCSRTYTKEIDLCDYIVSSLVCELM